MPSVKCPRCQGENVYPVERSGRAMICTQCGFAIPSQLTVAPDAKPRVTSTAAPNAKEKENTSRYAPAASFASSYVARTSRSASASKVIFVALAVFGMALCGIILWAMSSIHSGPMPPLTESPAPPRFISSISVDHQPQEFIIIFSLFNEQKQSIAKSGFVKLTISEISHIGMEGAGVFANEKKLYEQSFPVDLTHFKYSPFAFGGPPKVICPIRLPINQLKSLPPSGREGKVTIRFFNTAEETKMQAGAFHDFFF